MKQRLIIFFSILFLGLNNLEAKTAGCRFSADPLAEVGVSITPYGYCGNNPLVRIDPDGRSFDWYQSDYGSVRWFRSSRERLFFHSEWWTRLGAEYSLELGDGRFLNFYQNVPVSLTDSRESVLLGILNNDGFKGFLLSNASPLDEEYRHDIVRRSIHYAQNEFLDHPLVRGMFDVVTFVKMGGVESLFSLSSSLCGFAGKHFGRTAIKTSLRAAKRSNFVKFTSTGIQKSKNGITKFSFQVRFPKSNLNIRLDRGFRAPLKNTTSNYLGKPYNGFNTHINIQKPGSFNYHLPLNPLKWKYYNIP